MCAAGVAVRPILMASKWSRVSRQIAISSAGVAPVALVGDDQVEGVDRDVELVGVVAPSSSSVPPKTRRRGRRG